MSNQKYQKFSPEAVRFLEHMMNMTLNKAEQLSRGNQLTTGNSRSKIDSSEVFSSAGVPVPEKMDIPRSSVGALKRPSMKFSDYKPQILNTSKINKELKQHTGSVVRLDMLSNNDTVGDGKDYGAVKIELLRGCPSAIFNYLMRARKDGKYIHLPAQVAVTQLHERGVFIDFHVDTKQNFELPPLDVQIFCPNYKPEQVWINAKKWNS